jgi:hypothetical protein
MYYFNFLIAESFYFLIANLKRGSGSSVGMIMVQFDDLLCQRSEVQISIRSGHLIQRKFSMKRKKSMIYPEYF